MNTPAFPIRVCMECGVTNIVGILVFSKHYASPIMSVKRVSFNWMCKVCYDLCVKRSLYSTKNGNHEISRIAFSLKLQSHISLIFFEILSVILKDEMQTHSVQVKK